MKEINEHKLNEAVKIEKNDIVEKARAEAERLKRMKEDEEKRQREVEKEKQRLWNEERERERKQVEEERRARIEEDRRIAREIMERKQQEEEESKRIKLQIEEEKLKEIEKVKRLAMEEKKKNLFKKKEEPETPIVPERPKKKSISNPLAKKFEEIAKTAVMEEKIKLDLEERKNRIKMKSKNMIRKSRQMLLHLSKENIKGSPKMAKRKSRDSLFKFSTERLRQSREQIKCSKDSLRKSRTCVNMSGEKSSAVSKKSMQNYLISQVLFDGEEQVDTLKHIKEKEKEEENKRKEMAMIEREQEVKRQIKAELLNIKKAEEELKLKQQEANFEAYKREMEDYLNFVCDEKEHIKQKKNTKKKEKVVEKKLKLNINSIKQQFEFGCESSSAEVTSPTQQVVNKLDPNKFLQQTEQSKETAKKKEYIPVIIDKAAFERTVGLFEKEKREEEERRLNEERLKQRRQEMIREKERLQEEKKRLQLQEEAHQKHLEDLRQKELKEEKEKLKFVKKEDPENNVTTEIKTEPVIQIPKPIDIQERIRQELEKIRQEEEIQSKKIARENKKKQLMRQIQSEIEKINTAGTPEKDETPAWIKMVMNQSNKKESEKKPMPEKTSEATYSNNFDVEKEIETPKWIQIFQEKSKQIEEMKKKAALEAREVEKIKLEKVETAEIKEQQIKDIFSKQTLSKPIEKFHSNSVESEETKVPNKGEDILPIKTKGTSVKDRVRKVKSMIFDSDFKIEKKETVAVEKDKASKIKNLFETKPSELPKKEVKRPKKKIVKVPVSDLFDARPKQVEKDWKWKSKNSQELYDFINCHKEFLPDQLSKKVETTLNQIHRQDVANNNDSDIAQADDEEQYVKYIESVHSYLDKEDRNETETIFKDTILAYLDLIDDKPWKKTESLALKSSSNLLVGTMRGKLKGIENHQKEVAQPQERLIGKVDASFLLKPEHEDAKRNSDSMTTDLCSNLKSKFENIHGEEEPVQLYSMKRKLIPVKSDIDSMAWKKQQTEYQWKYKQKNISELQDFLKKAESTTKDDEKVDYKPYVSILPKIDFASRLADEEKRMKEFENFMDEIHDYLEKDSMDESESSFKWQIQSYLDLIEDESTSAPGEVPRKDKSDKKIQEKLPNTAELKLKLEESFKEKNKSADITVGKLNQNLFFDGPDNNTSNFNSRKKSIPEIKGNLAKSLKSNFENIDTTEDNSKKVVVKRKLIAPVLKEENSLKPNVIIHNWKYKQNTLEELKNFIRNNKDMAPEDLIKTGSTLYTDLQRIESKELIEKSKVLSESMIKKENEFNNFMAELENFSNNSSSSKAEEEFKNELKSYLSFIETNKTSVKGALPSLSSAISVSEIQGRLKNQTEQQFNRKSDNNTAIGKVSMFFKKSTKEGCNNSNIMKENIASLLQPGKAKTLKNSFETKPKLKRSVSELDINPGKINIKNLFFKPDTREPVRQPRQETRTKSFHRNEKTYETVNKASDNRKEELMQVKKDMENSKGWSRIEDPEERKNAILAKYGFKPARKVKDTDEDSDIEDYLNYENTAEIADYERKLKEQYCALESDSGSSSRESSPGLRDKNAKTGSFSSLLNILQTMRKSNISKKFTDSKSKVLEFSDCKQSFSRSEVDLSEIQGSCSNIKGLFESGKVFSSNQNRRTMEEDETLAEAKASEKRKQWEQFVKDKFTGSTSSEHPKLDVDLPSVNKFKSMFESGELSAAAVHQYIENRSVSIRADRKHSADMCEEDFDGNQTIEEELEALRRSSKMKQMNRIQRGDRPVKGVSGGLR